MAFRQIPEHRLAQLPDDELLAYLVAARTAGELTEASRALGIFCFRRRENLLGQALAKIGNREDAEDLVDEAIKGALESAFEGTSPGEAVNLVKTILRRRIADYYEALERRPRPDALPEEQDDEERKGADAGVSPDDKGAIFVEDVIEREYAKLSPHHRRVVDLRVFVKYSSKETVAMVNQEFPNLDTPMTPANVDQIASRFRKDMRGELDQGGRWP